jgi:hypothetical protein
LGIVGYLGDISNLGAVPYPQINANPSGTPMEEYMWAGIPDLSLNGGTGQMQYPLWDDWGALQLAIASMGLAPFIPAEVEITGGSINNTIPPLPTGLAPYNYGAASYPNGSAKYPKPYCIGFDVGGGLCSYSPTVQGIGMPIDVAITGIVAEDSAGAVIDVLQTQYGGAPVTFQFLLG